MLLDLLLGGFDNFLPGLLSILLLIPALLFALSCHEFAHGLAADKQGDHFARSMGRLTLNPMAHIDPLGFLCMLLVGFGWAKPVPIVPSNFRNGRKSMIIVSLAGVVTNLILAFLGLFLDYFLIYIVFFNVAWFQSGAGSVIVSILKAFFSLFVTININLAIFNLIPVPPLDGYKVFRELFGYKCRGFCEFVERYSTFILLILLLLLDRTTIFSFVSGGILGLMEKLMNLIFAAFI